MSAHLNIIFAPLIAPPWLFLLLGLAALFVFYALLRRARGALWRATASAFFILALANPSLIKEQHEPLKDVAIIAVDDSASMQLENRAPQAATALDALTKKLSSFKDMDTEIIHVKGSEETDLFAAIDKKLAAVPHDRLAGVIVLTDGEAHDKPSSYAAPFHALMAGHKNEVDRRLIVKEAPAYGLVGKNASLTLRIEDTPKAQSENATVIFRRGKGESQSLTIPVGKDVSFEAPVDHPGQNLFVFTAEPVPDELTLLNNTASVSVNGIRDRLRVLLVSGQPHIGGRTWRNFLKADPAVDLIHFTILRSPMKMDATPNTEMSLIAFPVHELFETKLNSFDLVILDRFRSQSLVPDEYLENIAKYVENGGALLVSNATEEGIPPLTFSPLARILPAMPTGKLLTGSFVPDLSEAGKRHPVTNTLTRIAPRDGWGPWFRQTGSRNAHGETVMTGLDGQPLLILDHVKEGRVAQFLSDQFWLWSRNYRGGGPQAELLRRVAHWLVDEPELDEAALHASSDLKEDGWQLTVTKQSLHDDSDSVSVTDPDGKTSQLTLSPSPLPGVLSATMPVATTGLYEIKDSEREILAMVGPKNAPEFGEMIATADKVKPATDASGGGIFWLDDRADGPNIHRTSASAAQEGWDWIGLVQNGKYRVVGSKAWPLLPPWLAALLILGSSMLAWRREGRG